MANIYTFETAQTSLAMKTNIICEKSFQFSLDLIKLYKLMLSKNDFVLSKQIIRCGTSIGANVNEAQAGLSKRDFIAKMSISSKEARESLYWLKLLKESCFIEYDFDALISKNEELVKILTSIVKTAEESLTKTPKSKN